MSQAASAAAVTNLQLPGDRSIHRLLAGSPIFWPMPVSVGGAHNFVDGFPTFECRRIRQPLCDKLLGQPTIIGIALAERMKGERALIKI